MKAYRTANKRGDLTPLYRIRRKDLITLWQIRLSEWSATYTTLSQFGAPLKESHAEAFQALQALQLLLRLTSHQSHLQEHYPSLSAASKI